MDMYEEVLKKIKHPVAKDHLTKYFEELKIQEDEEDNDIPLKDDMDRATIPELIARIESAYTESEREALVITVLPVNERGLYGMTKAHHAAEEGDLALLKELVGSGADLDIRCNANHTPRDKAARRGHLHILEYIDNISR